MKRQLIIGTLAVAAISLASISGTLAVTNVSNNINNAVTTGSIKIAIEEKFNPEEAVNLAPRPESNLKPITKEVRINNTGGDAFVRVGIEKLWGSMDGEFYPDDALSTANIQLNFSEALNTPDNWYDLGDGYYYIRLESGEKSPVLLESFDYVAVENLDSMEYRGHMAQINVEADAIQEANTSEYIGTYWGVTYENGTFTKVNP